MKLRTKLLGFLVPLVAVPLLFLGWIGFKQLSAEAEETILREMNTLQSQLARGANTRLQTAQSNAKLFSESGLLKDFIFASEADRYRFVLLPLLELFSGYNRAYPDYYRIQVASPTGEELAAFDPLASSSYSEQEMIDPSFFERISASSQPIHAEYRFDPGIDRWSLFVSQQLKFLDPTFEDSTIATPSLRGYLILTVGLDDLREQIQRIHPGQTGQNFLTTPGGEILFPEVPQIRQKKLTEEITSEIQTMAVSGADFEVKLGDTAFIADAKEIEGGPLLVSILPREELTRAGRELGLAVIVICVIAIIGTVVCLFLVLKFAVTSPLQVLGDGAKQIESGNLDVEIEIKGNSELTALAHQFNAMARGIKENKRLRDAAQAEALSNKELAITSLEKADRLKDEFLANTSHELRTPLHGMIGVAESLLSGSAGSLSDRATSNLELIVAGGRRLANLVNDILDFSKLQNDDLRLNLKTVDVRSVCSLVMTTLQPTLKNRDIELRSNIAKDLPLVTADENRLQQIFYNIIGNALKFTEQGHVEISAVLKGKNVEVAISDTGIGIPEDQREVIFNSFQQLDSAADRTQGGTGLGLTITRKLIESHGGDIRVESTVGEGSVFSFSLPIASHQIKPEPSEDPLHSGVAKIPAPEPLPVTIDPVSSDHLDLLNGKGRTILVVDDEPMNLKVVENHLSLCKFSIHLASSGSEALEWLETPGNQPDLVLLDVMMPRMDGFKVCKIIRKTHPPTDLPIIFLTARSAPEDIAEGMAVGGNDYIPKPFAQKEFFARIQLHMELAESSRTLRDWTLTLEERVLARTKELERANQRLEKQNEILVENENLRRDMERITQHDLRSPIAGIISLAEIILEEHEDDTTAEELKSIIDSGYDVLNMITQTQDMHKLEDGSYNLQIKEFNLVEALFRIGRDTTNLQHKKESELVIRLGDRRASASDFWTIRADKSLIYLALSNLINNALEATPRQEKVEISLSRTGSVTKIDIHNQGAIPEEVRDRFFDKYATAGKTKGNGIGTYSAQLIIRHHGGTLSFTTDDSTGTTLSITLPDPQG